MQYLYIRHNNLYLLALTKRNTNAAEILLFLHKIVEVFTEYFKELEEESIRDNFVVIYELLDEMMDFGYPQTTESKILQEYITQESHKLEIQARPPIAVTNAVSWRSEGIRYRKNEVFLDVIESLNLLVSSNGNVLRSEILGAIKMKCYLSGMPELRLGLNDKVMFETTGRATRGKAIEMEDVKFHQCVRLSRFENDRTISFIPPDGEFELMSYRLNTQVKPLIWVECVVESHSGSRIEYLLKAKSQFKRRSTANNVEIIVPVPDDADSPRFRTNIGSVHYAPEKSAIVWKIKQFGGNKEFLMRAELGLPSVKGDDELGGGMTGGFGGSMGGVGGGKGAKRPISVKFEIPYFTTSGIQVRYLKIIEPKVCMYFSFQSLSLPSRISRSWRCSGLLWATLHWRYMTPNLPLDEISRFPVPSQTLKMWRYAPHHDDQLSHSQRSWLPKLAAYSLRRQILDCMSYNVGCMAALRR